MEDIDESYKISKTGLSYRQYVILSTRCSLARASKFSIILAILAFIIYLRKE